MTDKLTLQQADALADIVLDKVKDDKGNVIKRVVNRATGERAVYERN